MPAAEAGFFVLLSLALAVILQLFSTGLRSASAIERQTQAVVLADSIAPYVNDIHDIAALGGSVGPVDAWGAAVGFQFQRS